MAYRRLAWIGKCMNLKLSYKSSLTIPRNQNGLLDLECHYRALPAAATHTRFFLPLASTLPKNKIKPFNNLSLVKNMSTLPQGKEMSGRKIEAEDPSETTKTLDGDNAGRGGEDKRLMDIAVGLSREMIEAEEQLKEALMLLEEIIGELTGFIAFLRWNVPMEKLKRVKDILGDVCSRTERVLAAREKLFESIEDRDSGGGDVQEQYADKIENAFADLLRVSTRMLRALRKCRKMAELLHEMREKRTRMLFYLSFLFGGR